MNVGTQGIRPELLRYRGPAHIEVEMHPSMSDVQDNATRPRLMHLRANPAIAVENAVRVTIQNVRGDIAGTHEIKDTHQGNGRIADVHHHLFLCGISDLTRHFQSRNGIGFARRPVVNTHFDAQDMLRVLGNTANRLVDLGIGDILQLANAHGQRGEASRTEVHKGVQACVGLPHNIVAEGRVIPPPGAASIHSGRDTRGETGRIRVHGTWPAAVKKVTVDVDQTRRHQVSTDVDDTVRYRHGQVRSERRYAAITKGHVAALLQTL